jgi:hypothetical protein
MRQMLQMTCKDKGLTILVALPGVRYYETRFYTCVTWNACTDFRHGATVKLISVFVFSLRSHSSNSFYFFSVLRICLNIYAFCSPYFHSVDSSFTGPNKFKKQDFCLTRNFGFESPNWILEILNKFSLICAVTPRKIKFVNIGFVP